MARIGWPVGIGFVCMVILVAAYFWLGWAPGAGPVKKISLRPSPGDSSPFPRHTNSTTKLRIAVGAIVSSSESLIFYEDIFDYIGEKLGREVEMVQRKTYAEVNLLMKEGRIDAAFVCSRPYAEGRRDFGMELLCAPVCFGKAEYYSYFIVHKESGITDLAGLRGKLFAFSDRLSNTGMLIPNYTLAKMGETPDSFFRKHLFTYSHDNSIRYVARRDVDGAAVDSLIWEYLARKKPESTAQTRIIYTSPPCAIPPVVVSPDIDDELKERLRSAFLGMDKDQKGREILKKVLIDRFTLIDDSAYDSIREMETFLKDFRSQR